MNYEEREIFFYELIIQMLLKKPFVCDGLKGKCKCTQTFPINKKNLKGKNVFNFYRQCKCHRCIKRILWDTAFEGMKKKSKHTNSVRYNIQLSISILQDLQVHYNAAKFDELMHPRLSYKRIESARKLKKDEARNIIETLMNNMPELKPPKKIPHFIKLEQNFEYFAEELNSCKKDVEELQKELENLHALNADLKKKYDKASIKVQQEAVNSGLFRLYDLEPYDRLITVYENSINELGNLGKKYIEQIKSEIGKLTPEKLARFKKIVYVNKMLRSISEEKKWIASKSSDSTIFKKLMNLLFYNEGSPRRLIVILHSLVMKQWPDESNIIPEFEGKIYDESSVESFKKYINELSSKQKELWKKLHKDIYDLPEANEGIISKPEADIIQILSD